MKSGDATPERMRVSVYFSAIGLAFLFTEIACIQRFMLVLNHPTYAIAVVLSAFLLFAGIGSTLSDTVDRRIHERSAGRLDGLSVAVPAIMTLVVIFVFSLPSPVPALVLLPPPAKIAATLLLIAPLAFFMGMPFPLALGHLTAEAPSLVPRAWGINGCASVISAVLATLLAMSIGFTGVILLAPALYAVAAAVFRRSADNGTPANAEKAISR